MKFIDTFNEDDKKRLTKKAKLIYSVLKKGTITRSDGVKFSYELGNNMVPSVVDGEIYLFAFITKIIERTYCPINEIAMSDLIMKKFDQFDIKVDLQIPKSIEIVKYKGKKPWEEQIDLNENHDENKLLKKGKTVYKALRKGTIGGDDPEQPHFTYVLSDDFTVDINNAGILIFTNEVKIKQLNRSCDRYSNNYVMDLIRKRFEPFGITLSITSYYMDFKVEPWESPLNEDIDIDKERNRVKTIHKAIRKGIVNFEGNRFRYELPEEYTFHVVNKLDLQVTSIKFIFYNKDLSRDNGGGHGLPLKIWRIEGGKDVYLNKILTPQDVGDISYNDEYGITNKTGVEYVNVKNKVRNRYRNFNINAIMTTPSDTVMVNEDIDIDKDRILKKGMTVNKALRKGNLVIKYDHNEVEKNTKYRYELPERCNVTMRGESLRMSYRYDEGIKNIGDKFPLKIWTDVKGKEILLNTHMTNHDYDYIEDNMENTMLSYIFVKVMKNVKKRYEHFNIQLDLNPYRSSIPLFLHEEEEDNDLTKKDRKKIELIYGLFKRGKYTVEDILYNYVLPEEYWTSNNKETGELIVVLTMDPTQKMKLYAKIKKEDGNLYHREVPVEATQYASLYDDAKKRIKEKFERFNIEIVF